jgi:hypothetical protein
MCGSWEGKEKIRGRVRVYACLRYFFSRRKERRGRGEGNSEGRIRGKDREKRTKKRDREEMSGALHDGRRGGGDCKDCKNRRGEVLYVRR